MSETLPTETRDGFHLNQTKVELPLDNGSLDPKTQLDLLICHLFIKQKLAISDIACALNEGRWLVILALLEKGILKDRRQRPRMGTFISAEPRKMAVYDFKIFLSKISGKTTDKVLSAAEEEIHGLEFACPKRRSVSFTYLRDLRLLTSFIHVPPRPQDRRGPVPEHIKQTLRDLGLIPEPKRSDGMKACRAVAASSF